MVLIRRGALACFSSSSSSFFRPSRHCRNLISKIKIFCNRSILPEDFLKRSSLFSFFFFLKEIIIIPSLVKSEDILLEVDRQLVYNNNERRWYVSLNGTPCWAEAHINVTWKSLHSTRAAYWPPPYTLDTFAYKKEINFANKDYCNVLFRNKLKRPLKLSQPHAFFFLSFSFSFFGFMMVYLFASRFAKRKEKRNKAAQSTITFLWCVAPLAGKQQQEKKNRQGNKVWSSGSRPISTSWAKAFFFSLFLSLSTSAHDWPIWPYNAPPSPTTTWALFLWRVFPELLKPVCHWDERPRCTGCLVVATRAQH